MGPHPYPTMVRDFQKVIGEEAKKQLMEKEGRLPDCVVACVGGGSNAMGMFYDFIPDEERSSGGLRKQPERVLIPSCTLQQLPRAASAFSTA